MPPRPPPSLPPQTVTCPSGRCSSTGPLRPSPAAPARVPAGLRRGRGGGGGGGEGEAARAVLLRQRLGPGRRLGRSDGAGRGYHRVSAPPRTLGPRSAPRSHREARAWARLTSPPSAPPVTARPGNPGSARLPAPPRCRPPAPPAPLRSPHGRWRRHRRRSAAPGPRCLDGGRGCSGGKAALRPSGARRRAQSVSQRSVRRPPLRQRAAAARRALLTGRGDSNNCRPPPARLALVPPRSANKGRGRVSLSAPPRHAAAPRPPLTAPRLGAGLRQKGRVNDGKTEQKQHCGFFCLFF